MAFESLSEKLQNVFKNLRGKGRLSEDDVRIGLKEVRLALLEADVSFKVVKDFIKGIQEKATGADVLNSLTPAQQVIKIVNEEMVSLMGSETTELKIKPSGEITVIMMAGLQGAGKTTTTAKLAGKLKKKGSSPLLVGCDIYSKELIADAYNVDAFYKVSLAVDVKQYLEDVINICKNENIDYILPLIDIEIDVFNTHRYIFEKLGIKLLIADKFCIDTCRDKLKTYEYLLGDESVNLIRGYTKDYIDKQIEDSNFHYCLLVKPLDGRSSEGLRRINNKYDWYAFINSEDTDRYLIQDFIKGNVKVFDTDKEKKASPPILLSCREGECRKRFA